MESLRKSLAGGSSVARGGGGGSSPPPRWLVKYAKSHVFYAFEADFLWKMENSPPIRKEPPLKRSNLRNWKKNHPEFWRRPFFFYFFGDHLILGGKNLWILDSGRKITLNFGEAFFFFWDHLILGGKNLWILDFGRKITLNFGEDLFFFWRSPNFGRKNPLNLRAFRDISSQVLDKPSETDSRSMKIRVKVVCTLLTLSK